MLAGIDVSNYQPVIDWRAVGRAGAAFAWVLITDGTRFVNGKGLEQAAGARGAGLDVGGYHFARPNLNAAAVEAQHYQAHAPDGLTLPPALDLEAAWLGSRAANTDWALRWFDTIDPAVRLIYTNGDGARNRLDSGRLAGAGVELWYAHPTGAPGNFAGVGAWTTPSVVQWGVEPIDGIAGGVDRNAMTEQTLARYRGADPGDSHMPLDPADKAYLESMIKGTIESVLKGEFGLDEHSGADIRAGKTSAPPAGDVPATVHFPGA